MSPFFDTNILVYAFSTDPRRAQAQQVLASGGTISAQVLNEFTNVLRKRRKQHWSAIEAAVLLLRSRFDAIRPLTAETHASAIAVARDHGMSFYDSLIIASALDAACDTLVTEHMQHGRTIGRLTIRNPFL
ncbi:MAG: PIN domain-containing protein [Methylobacteriaceae bacterium]|nr:PIN domain-containing protein [Methylobacteriaceae bacterium]MBV9703711.1 PIN domain-containing protein [Methylobacteriaceae bacterium]